MIGRILTVLQSLTGDDDASGSQSYVEETSKGDIEGNNDDYGSYCNKEDDENQDMVLIGEIDMSYPENLMIKIRCL